MKGFKKLLSVVLILVLSLVATVSSAACNLSELKFDIINTTTKKRKSPLRFPITYGFINT